MITMNQWNQIKCQLIYIRPVTIWILHFIIWLTIFNGQSFWSFTIRNQVDQHQRTISLDIISFSFDSSTKTIEWSRNESNWYSCSTIQSLQRSRSSCWCNRTRYLQYYLRFKRCQHSNSIKNGASNGNDQCKLSLHSNDFGKTFLFQRRIMLISIEIFLEYRHVRSWRFQIQLR